MVKGVIKRERRYTTITIPSTLFEKIKSRIEGTGFSSVSDYVTYILRETVAYMEMSGKKGSRNRDESIIIEKLRALGYIDDER